MQKKGLILLFFASCAAFPAPVRASAAAGFPSGISATGAVSAKASAVSGFFSSIWFCFVRAQMEMNRKISRILREVKKEKSKKAFLFLMLLSFVYGFLHSLGPGHGKIVMASYFTGRSSHWLNGAVMGAQIAFVHSVSAVVLVFMVRNVAAYVFGAGSSREMAFLKLASYAGIFLAGVLALIETAGSGKGKRDGAKKSYSGKSQCLLALSVGIVPCAGVLLILFYAMAQNMLATGLLAAVSVSAGMALALSLIGAGFIKAEGKMEGFVKSSSNVKIFRALRYSGAAALMLFGAVLFFYTLKFI